MSCNLGPLVNPTVSTKSWALSESTRGTNFVPLVIGHLTTPPAGDVGLRLALSA